MGPALNKPNPCLPSVAGSFVALAKKNSEGVRKDMDKGLKPPKQIWYSLYAFLSTIPVVIGDFLLSAFRYKDLSLWDINAYLLDLAITVLIILLIFRRKNWARIVYTILNGLVVLVAFWIIKNVSYRSLYNVISLSLQVVLRLLSVYFLFVKESQEWFRPSYIEDIAAQRGTNESMLGSDSFARDDTRSAAGPSRAELTRSARETTLAKSLGSILKEKRRPLLVGGLIFSVCFLIALIYVGRRAAMAGAIHRALSADVALSRRIFANRSMTDSDAETIQAYTQGLRGIDMSHCPRDFQLAYLDHIHACESLARAPDPLNLRFLIDLLVLKKLPNIPDDQPIHDEIARTWNEIERIALSYGVRVSEPTR